MIPTHDSPRSDAPDATARPIAPPTLRRVSALAALLLVAQSPLAAQQTPRWVGNAEANGNFLYGAASQRVFTAGVSEEYQSESIQFRFDIATGYGDARQQDSGVRRVVVRNTRASTSLDMYPKRQLSPFSFASGESSLQQRIASRYSAGAGAKWTIWRPDSVTAGFPEETSLSGAVLGEETRALVLPNANDQLGGGSRYRWSLRGRSRRRISKALRLSHLSLYQPTVGRLAQYTFEATTTVSVPLRSRTEFTVTHRERIDSEAIVRGASSTRDGQLLFGVRTSF